MTDTNVAGTATGSAAQPVAPQPAFDQLIIPVAPKVTPQEVVAAQEALVPTSGTIWSVAFWKGASERAIKTFFQTGLAYVGVTALLVTDVNWVTVAEAGALGAILSLATSIGNASFTAGK